MYYNKRSEVGELYNCIEEHHLGLRLAVWRANMETLNNRHIESRTLVFC